jgi:hypothetical protein
MEDIASGVGVDLMTAFNNGDYAVVDPYVYLEYISKDEEPEIIKAPPNIFSSKILRCETSGLKSDICTVTIYDDEIIITVNDPRLLNFYEQDIQTQGYLLDYYDLYDTGYMDVFHQRLLLDTKTYWHQINTQYVPWFYSKFLQRGNLPSYGATSQYLDDLITNSYHPIFRFRQDGQRTLSGENNIERRIENLKKFAARSHGEYYQRHVPINKYKGLNLPSTGTIEEQLKEDINYYKHNNIIRYVIDPSSIFNSRQFSLLSNYPHTETPEGEVIYNIPLNVFKRMPKTLNYYRTLEKFYNQKRIYTRYLVNNDYASPGIMYPPRFEGMLYTMVETAPVLDNNGTIQRNVREMPIKLLPWMAANKDFCDLVLKSPLAPKPEHIRQGLFFLYLEETLRKNFATRDDRFIFNGDQFKHLIEVTGRNIFKSFYFLPYVPKRIHLFQTKKMPVFTFPTPEEITDVIPIVWRFRAPSGRTLRANLNGSTLTKFFLNKRNFNDIDIRVDYVDSDELVSDEDFDAYIQTFEDTPEKSNTKRYKYKVGQYDVYRAPFGVISNYHVAAVRINFDGEQFLFYPSAMMALTTGLCPDLRYFTTKHGDPMKIVDKYLKLGFGFVLNHQEVASLLNYLSTKDLDIKYALFAINTLLTTNLDFNTTPLYVLKELASMESADIHKLLDFINNDEYDEINNLLSKYPSVLKMVKIVAIILQMLDTHPVKFSPETLEYLKFSM